MISIRGPLIRGGAGSSLKMTEEKYSDVIVAVWLAGCEYFYNGLSYFLTHRQRELTTWSQNISFREN